MKNKNKDLEVLETMLMRLCARVVNAKNQPSLRDGIHLECLEVYIVSQSFERGTAAWKRAQEEKKKNHLKLV